MNAGKIYTVGELIKQLHAYPEDMGMEVYLVDRDLIFPIHELQVGTYAFSDVKYLTIVVRDDAG